MAEDLKVSDPYHFCSCHVMLTNTCPSGSNSSFAPLLYLSLNLYFQRVGEAGLKHLESCFPVNLWPLGLNAPPAWWLGSLLLSSGCSGAPALLSCMQYPTMCSLSEAVSNSGYKRWLICFTSCFTWLLSVPSSPMRFTGFHVHGSCFLI